MYKYSINDLPNSFKDFFKKRSDIHGYHTRHANDYEHTKNTKYFSDRAIRHTGPILWESIPKTIRDSKSVKNFRKQFKHTLIQNYA